MSYCRARARGHARTHACHTAMHADARPVPQPSPLLPLKCLRFHHCSCPSLTPPSPRLHQHPPNELRRFHRPRHHKHPLHHLGPHGPRRRLRAARARANPAEARACGARRRPNLAADAGSHCERACLSWIERLRPRRRRHHEPARDDSGLGCGHRARAAQRSRVAGHSHAGHHRRA